MQRQDESQPLLNIQYPNYTEQESSTIKDKGKEKVLTEEKLIKDHFSQLPNEVIEYIVKFLSLRDMLLFMQVNHGMNQITKHIFADDVNDLREMIICAKEEIENEPLSDEEITDKKMDDGHDIENPDEERSIFFKNKSGKKSTVGELLSRMNECWKVSQQIPKLRESADHDDEKINCLKDEICSKKRVVSSSVLFGGVAGGGTGLGATYVFGGGSSASTAVGIGTAVGGLLGCFGSLAVLTCTIMGISFFANKKLENADELEREMDNDTPNQLLTYLLEHKTLTKKK